MQVLRVTAPASFDGHNATITVTATNANNETASNNSLPPRGRSATDPPF